MIVTPFYLTTAAAALAAAGDTEAARDRLLEAIAVGEQTGMRFYEAEARAAAGSLAGDDDATSSTDSRVPSRSAASRAARPFELRIALDLDARGAPAGGRALEAAVPGSGPTPSWPTSPARAPGSRPASP